MYQLHCLNSILLIGRILLLSQYVSTQGLGSGLGVDQKRKLSKSAKRSKASKPRSGTAFSDFVCQGATLYETESQDSGDKIALKFYPQDDAVDSWALIVACSNALQERYKARNVTDKGSVPFDTVEGMELLIPNKTALMEAPFIGNLTLGELKDKSTNATDPS